MRSHVLLFIAFADSFGFLDFPVGARTLLAFGEFLLRTYRAPKSVLNAFASLRHFSLDFNLDVSAFQERSVLLWRRALPLTCRHSVSQAPPITLELLERLCLLSDRLGEAGLVFAALLALLFATMARLSSFLPQYGRAFDRTRQPTFADVRRKGGIWHIFIKWAKAHQDASMGYWVPISPRLGSPACPVTRWLQLRQLAGGSFLEQRERFGGERCQGAPLHVTSQRMAAHPAGETGTKRPRVHFSFPAQGRLHFSFLAGGDRTGHPETRRMEERSSAGVPTSRGQQRASCKGTSGTHFFPPPLTTFWRAERFAAIIDSIT